MSTFLYKELTYELIGIGMEVHRHLGHGFLEAVYKDALEYELKSREISFVREKRYEVRYKGNVLPHFYVADFVINNEVIMEIKAQYGFADANYKQVINYLAVSKFRCGLLLNFGEPSLKYRRVML